MAEATAEATPVVFHSAALAYLTADERTAAAAAITGSGARWVSFEGRDVEPRWPAIFRSRSRWTPRSSRRSTGCRLALASGHADVMTLLGS